MCDACKQIGIKIERYRKHIAQGLDPLTVDRINALIQDLERTKQAMHQEPS
jgi:hypothetical protein